MTSVVVIGAGIGGIAVAARLARRGFRVTVLEKNSAPGGRTAVLERNGFKFDMGPSLFLMPDVFRRTYADLGEQMEDHLDLVRLDPTYRVHFHDGAWIDLTGDLVRMREQLDAIEPGSFDAYLRFLHDGYSHYWKSIRYFVDRNFYSLGEYLAPANLPLLFELKALQKHYPHVSRFFKDQRLRAAFSFQNVYLGTSPYEAMATYTLLQYTELGEGVWFPRGGMYRVIESLTAVAGRNGATFRCNAAVARIDIDEARRRVQGVTLENGEQIPADIVIANADLPYVYDKLLPPSPKAERLKRMRYTSSAIMFYWGLRGPRAPELLHHNVFLADHDYKRSFDRIFQDLTLPDEPSFYVCAPTATDPSFAPPDHDNLMVLVPVGYLNEAQSQDWDALTDRAREAVLSRLARAGVSGVRQRIVFEHTLNPLTYRDTLNLAKGAAFGLSHNFLQVGYLRPHNRHARYGNLYFVGASTHPGTGLPIVLISAKLVAERIATEQPN
ncbi:MAG: phytoene desaturase family protein [Anaerolineae bacterium]|nr:phytoene desaturase family protein [Thermoflexales bacterium]MDW8407448.1 phytoene desaturase family protein [Anaerolineae bacterium]